MKRLDPLLRAYLRLIAVMVMTMTLHRILFLSWYGESGLVSGLAVDLAKAFWLGLRFDLSVLVYLTTLPLLLYFFLRLSPSLRLWRNWKSLAVGYWSIVFIVIQILATGDFFYYMHFQDRLNVVMVGLFTDDTRALLSTIWKNYPVGRGLIAFVFLGAFGFWLTKKLVVPLPMPGAFRAKVVLPSAFLSLAILIMVGRGSFTFYPLGLIHTQVSTNPFINLLTVNAPFRMKTAFKQYFQSRMTKRGNIKAYGFEGKEADAFLASRGSFVNQSPIETLAYTPRRFLKADPHVVIVLMESLGSYWLQFQQPGFDLLGPLNNELKDAAVTLKMVPGAIGTIGSLAGILSGVPAGAKSAILSESPYQNLQMPTSPALFFNARGYQTRFVYGGNLGWRNIGAFARRQGFMATDGEVEIEKHLGKLDDSTHDWGVFDDRLFNYVLHTLVKAKQPEFIVVMTTSNHPPFAVPKNYKVPEFNIPPGLRADLLVDEKVALERFIATRFANDSLAEFRKQLKLTGLARKSALAVTGDHGFWFARLGSDQVAQKYLVPFALWQPSEKLRERAQARLNSGFTSHLHILPTLYDLVQTGGADQPTFFPSIFSDQKLVGYSSQSFAFFPDSAVNLNAEPIEWCYEDSDFGLPELTNCKSTPSGNPQTFKAFMATTDFFLEAVK